MIRTFTRLLLGMVVVGAALFGWNRLAAAQGGLALSINDITVTEGDSGNTNATFTVSLSTRHFNTVKVKLQLANGSGRIGTDLVDVTPPGNLPTLTFAANVQSQTFTVPIVGERIHESDETYFLNLVEPEGAAIADGQGRGTIVNDDPIPSLSIGNGGVQEGNSGNSIVQLVLVLSNPTSHVVTTNLSTANGSATAGADYSAVSQSVTIPAGRRFVVVRNITVAGENVHEPDETFLVNISTPTNATLADGQATVTIRNDDQLPQIVIDDTSVLEGNSGTQTANVRLRLSNPSSQVITVNAATADNSAKAGTDYQAKAASVRFAAGSTSVHETFVVNGDTLFENDEAFLVNLTNPVNAAITDTQGSMLITNEDQAPAVSVSTVSTTEGTGGTKTLTFNVQLSTAAGKQIVVNAATADGSATSPRDYAAKRSRVIFPEGQTSKAFVVSLVTDSTREPNETFRLNLTSLSNGTAIDAAVGTIVNDDPVPSVRINDFRLAETNGGTQSVTLAVQISNPSSSTISVAYATANGSAAAGGDYVATNGTLTFSPGQTSRGITFTINGDTTIEPDETFFVNLSGATNATIVDAQGSVTIRNDDPFIRIGNVSAPEPDTGTRNAIFQVTLSSARSEEVRVQFTTVNGTGVAGSDYIAQNGTLAFAPGQTSAVISVPVIGDTVAEPDETFGVRLSFPVNAFIEDDTGTARIVNED